MKQGLDLTWLWLASAVQSRCRSSLISATLLLRELISLRTADLKAESAADTWLSSLSKVPDLAQLTSSGHPNSDTNMVVRPHIFSINRTTSVPSATSFPAYTSLKSCNRASPFSPEHPHHLQGFCKQLLHKKATLSSDTSSLPALFSHLANSSFDSSPVTQKHGSKTMFPQTTHHSYDKNYLAKLWWYRAWTESWPLPDSVSLHQSYPIKHMRLNTRFYGIHDGIGPFLVTFYKLKQIMQRLSSAV